MRTVSTQGTAPRTMLIQKANSSGSIRSRLNVRRLFAQAFPTASSRRSVASGLALVLGLFAVTFGSTLAVGRDGFDRILLLQVGLILGAVFLLALFHLPQAGIAALLVGAILVKKEISTETQTMVNAAIALPPVLISVWLIHRLFGRREQQPVSSRTLVPIYLFLIIACLAFAAGQYPWFPAPAAPMPAQIGQLMIFLFSGGMFLVSAYQLQDVRWLKLIAYGFIAIGSIHLLPRIMPISSLSGWSYLPGNITGQSMFWTWLVALSFGQAMMNRRLRPAVRMMLSAVALSAIILALTELGWVSGWAPCLIAVSVILFLRFPTTAILALPVLVIIVLTTRFFLWDLVAAGDNLYSLNTRTAALNSLLPIMKANPLLGLGPANYYHYTILNPIIGWYVKFNSHNNYLDLIAQTGVAGLASFLWFVCAVGRTAWNLRFRVTEGFEFGYVCSVFAGLLATLSAAFLGDWVIPFVYNTGFSGFRASIIPWIFMGGLVALEQRRMRKT